MVWDADQPANDKKWIRIAAFLAGIASGTNIPRFRWLFLSSIWPGSSLEIRWLVSRRWRSWPLDLESPARFPGLNQRTFAAGFIALSHWLKLPSRGLWIDFFFPFFIRFLIAWGHFCHGPE